MRQSVFYRPYRYYRQLHRTIILNRNAPRLMVTASTSLLYVLHSPHYLALNDQKIDINAVSTTETQSQTFHTLPSASSLLGLAKEYLKYLRQQFIKVWYIIMRSTYLAALFTPAIVTSPVLLVGYDWKNLRTIWWDLLRFTIRVSGPCNTKLCQWIATRPDLFPLEMVQELSLLQTKAYKHSWEESARALEDGLGSGWHNMLELSSESPVLGSGCIASVYLGLLKDSKQQVAVKIIHPGVEEIITADIMIMKTVSTLLECLPGMSTLSICESVEEFEKLMINQVNFITEANNLRSLHSNFQKDHVRNVCFPAPFDSLGTKNILVETFQEGTLMSNLLKEQTSDLHKRKQLAKIGLDAILRMVFKHNFIHADLHPGNIIVQGDLNNLKLCLIDAGIVAELSPADRENFIALFKAVITNDGKNVGKLMIERSRGNISDVIDREGFENGMAAIVDEVFEHGLSLGRIGIGDLLQRVLVLCFNHHVKLESSFVSVVVAIGVLEGLGRRLDPDVDLIGLATPYILGHF